MSWEYTENSPYVEHPTIPSLHPTTPLQSASPFWPTPSTQSGLTPHPPGTNPQLLSQARKRSSHTQQTPPLDQGHIPQHFLTPGSNHRPSNMDNQRRMSSVGNRPVMGPPETPSRGMLQASPSMFPTPLFSPDMFSQQTVEPQSAPVYPQQRLFWDPASTPLNSTPQQFHTPTAFPGDFSTSFNSNSTIMQPDFHVNQDCQPYDLPATTMSLGMDLNTSFMDNTTYPLPFQTSPNMRPPQPDNPTHFLSSPARRFGGPDSDGPMQTRRAQPSLPAYHHQIQESRREQELTHGRRRSRTTKRSTDEDVLMRSVRRALSPTKQPRLPLQRSNTHTGARLPTSTMRRSSGAAFADAISIGSNSSSRSSHASRISPTRRNRDVRRQSSASVLRSKSSMSLAIDDFGIARTIMTSLPDEDDEDMRSIGSISEASENDDDQKMLYSFTGEEHDTFDDLSGDARDHLRNHTSTYLSMDADRVARIHSDIDTHLSSESSDPMATIKAPRQRARTGTITSTNTDATSGNAQHALRAMLLDTRARSASSLGDPSSNSSVQFHSSPPLHQGTLFGFNASPTTTTDHGLATPSTDAGSSASNGGTRCVCHSTSPDGNIMIQCDNCNKWLHARCVGLQRSNLPEIYICSFCERQHPSTRPSTIRNRKASALSNRSPLAHKSRMHRGR